jgi:S-DNA-T family DNA segregation ATPase FtsK/SpoIIIE
MTWTLPDLELPCSEAPAQNGTIKAMGEQVVEKLAELGVSCELNDTHIGPSVVRFDLRALNGSRMVDFTRLKRADDLAFELGVPSVVIHAPIPGERAVGVEVTNPVPVPVRLGDVLSAAQAPLTAALGMNGDGPLALNLAEAPHTLLAGRSGAGKSTALHSILASLAMVSSPDDLRMVLCDTKMVELSRWQDLPHLYGSVLTSIDRLLDGFDWCVLEMESRYERISKWECRDIADWNARYPQEKIPYCLLVVDELADAMMAAKGELESYIVRIGQKGRAAGIHMLLATQSPRSQVFTGLLKANSPARVALATVTALDSRIIIDVAGAEKLQGKGDGYLNDGISGALTRFQAPLVEQETINAIVNQWKQQAVMA